VPHIDLPFYFVFFLLRVEQTHLFEVWKFVPIRCRDGDYVGTGFQIFRHASRVAPVLVQSDEWNTDLLRNLLIQDQ